LSIRLNSPDGSHHFHVPLSNYAGWLFTSSCILVVNQRFDAWLRRARVVRLA
jgi:uncharacterized membrane protein